MDKGKERADGAEGGDWARAGRSDLDGLGLSLYETLRVGDPDMDAGSSGSSDAGSSAGNPGATVWAYCAHLASRQEQLEEALAELTKIATASRARIEGLEAELERMKGRPG